MPAWEECQGVEAALASNGTTIPLSLRKIPFTQLLGVAKQATHLSQLFEPDLFTPNPVVGHPTPIHEWRIPSSKGKNAYGVLVQPLWHPRTVYNS